MAITAASSGGVPIIQAKPALVTRPGLSPVRSAAASRNPGSELCRISARAVADANADDTAPALVQEPMECLIPSSYECIDKMVEVGLRIVRTEAGDEEVRLDIRQVGSKINLALREWAKARAEDKFGPRHIQMGTKNSMNVCFTVMPVLGEPGDPIRIESTLNEGTQAGPTFLYRDVERALEAQGWLKSYQIDVYGKLGDAGELILSPMRDDRLEDANLGLRHLFKIRRGQLLNRQHLGSMGALALYATEAKRLREQAAAAAIAAATAVDTLMGAPAATTPRTMGPAQPTAVAALEIETGGPSDRVAPVSGQKRAAEDVEHDGHKKRRTEDIVAELRAVLTEEAERKLAEQKEESERKLADAERKLAELKQEAERKLAQQKQELLAQADRQKAELRAELLAQAEIKLAEQKQELLAQAERQKAELCKEFKQKTAAVKVEMNRLTTASTMTLRALTNLHNGLIHVNARISNEFSA